MTTRGRLPIGLPSNRRGRRGLTMAEMVLTLAIMSILMTGLTSAILLSTHALPDEDSPVEAAMTGADAVDRIVEELREALWVFERTPTTITFTIPDHDGDGLPERVRYAWSGASGDPVTRRYNGGDLSVVVEDVREFDLGYELTSTTEVYPGPVIESGEQILKSYDSSFSLSEVHVHDNSWWAQYFVPALPPEALTWKVTRVFFSAMRDHNDDNTTLVRLHLPDENKNPSDTIIASTSVKQLSLPTYFVWVERPFSNAGGLSPKQGLCLSFTTTDPSSAKLLYRSGGVAVTGLGWIEGKPEWTGVVAADKSGLFYAYGTYSTPGPDQTATRRYLTNVHIALRAGDDPAARVVTSAQTLNTPELLSGLWETDFTADPRQDHNGDGSGDWCDDGGSFTTGSLVADVWQVDSTLVTNPANDFAGLTTVDLRFRSTSVGDSGARFRINADWSGGLSAPIIARTQLQADATQTLTVENKTDVAGSTRLVSVAGLSERFVDLRLVIDPELDTVAVTVAGVHRGTYRYGSFIPPADKRVASLRADGTAEFDYVSIRVAE